MLFVGIDIGGTKKGQTIAVLGKGGRDVEQMWHGESEAGLAERILAQTGPDVIVAIDSPRGPAKPQGGKWGRECERQLHRTGIRCQWTPDEQFFNEPGEKRALREWMEVGFRVFEQFAGLLPTENVIEVFPSASYGRFGEEVITLPFNVFDRKYKADQLDAICCALTGWRYIKGEYRGVGDPDEGQIIIPK